MSESSLEPRERVGTADDRVGESAGVAAAAAALSAREGEEPTASPGAAICSPSSVRRTNNAGVGEAYLLATQKTKQEAEALLTPSEPPTAEGDCPHQAIPCDSRLSKAIRDPQDPRANCGVRARAYDFGDPDGLTSTSRCVDVAKTWCLCVVRFI